MKRLVLFVPFCGIVGVVRIKWTDRRFNFDFPAGIYPEMIERVRGTPARLED